MFNQMFSQMSKYILPFLWAIAFLLSLFGTDSDCQIAALSVGAGLAIGAGASLIGGLVSDYINAKEQADTNQANREIAAQNREWQSNENQLQRDWSERQWNMNNAYNTPSAIAARQRAAGFNPYLLGSELGQGQSNPASTSVSTSAPGTAPMVAPKIGQTSQAINSAYGSLVNYALQQPAVDAQAANQSAQADSTAISTAKELNKFDPDYRNSKGETRGDEYLRNYFGFQSNTRSEHSIDLEQAKANLQRSQAEAKMADIRAGIEAEFGRRRAESGIKYVESQTDEIAQRITESAARIGKMSSDAKVNEAQIAKLKKECAVLGQQYFTELAKQYQLKKVGDYYVASASQINLIKELVRDKLDYEVQMSRRANSESYSRYQSRELIRDWQESYAGKNTTFENFEIGQDVFLNQADKVLHTLSPLTPSTSYGTVEHNYHGLGYD